MISFSSVEGDIVVLESRQAPWKPNCTGCPSGGPKPPVAERCGGIQVLPHLPLPQDDRQEGDGLHHKQGVLHHLPRGNTVDYVLIRDGADMCNSELGRTGGKQEILRESFDNFYIQWLFQEQAHDSVPRASSDPRLCPRAHSA